MSEEALKNCNQENDRIKFLCEEKQVFRGFQSWP